MTNAIPKIYDKENEQWVELMAKPIAKRSSTNYERRFHEK